MSHLMISAAHKSSGKTTISIGLCAALRERGRVVQPFKKGPDYIDPLWLGAATGRSCYTLDFYTMALDEIDACFGHGMRGADIGIIEGNKGLYDGLDLDGSNSNAALAQHLDAPVVLVLDTQGMTRGIAPLILGYQAFEPGLRINGVILNKVGGSRHESKLRAVIEHYTDVKVVGAVARDPSLTIEERHLGLVPSNEAGEARALIDRLGHAVSQQVDLDALLACAADTGEARQPENVAATYGGLRIGVARDQAFGFYYPADLEAFERLGVELVRVDLIRDRALPDIDGLFIGGGFPETHARELAANEAMLGAVRDFIERNGPTYAECGGLMYLCRNLTWRGHTAKMVGVIAADVSMHAKPRGRGYVKLRRSTEHPWSGAGNQEVRAHEFHYSALESLPADTRFAYEVQRGFGIDGCHDGIVYKSLLANYCHLRHARDNPWVEQFLAKVASHKRSGDLASQV